MLKLTFDGKDFKDDQGRIAVNAKMCIPDWEKVKHIAIYWPHGYEVVKNLPTVDYDGDLQYPLEAESIKLLPPSESTKEKSLTRTLYDGIPKEIKEKVRQYAEKLIEESKNKTTMEDFKKLTTEKQTPTIATNSAHGDTEGSEPKPEPTKELIVSEETDYKKAMLYHSDRADEYMTKMHDVEQKLTASESRVKELEALVGEMRRIGDNMLAYWRWAISDPNFREYVELKLAVEKAKALKP